VNVLLGDCTKAKQKLGWKYSISFPDLVRQLVDADLEYHKQRVAAKV
jgi:GDPmannose 4,6-dehydratase